MSGQPIPTPCKRVCAVSGMTNLCMGCGRTLKEIATWTSLTDAERLQIMTALPDRLRDAYGRTP